MKQETETIRIPTTCKECYGDKGNGEFKLPRPQCWYEKAVKLQQMEEYFRVQLEMGLPIDVKGALKQIQPLAKQCLANLPKRANIVMEKKRITAMENNIMKTQDELKEIKTLIENISVEKTNHIFKDEKELETEIKEVKREPRDELNYTFHESDVPTRIVEKSKPKPVGGWKKYQRNVKKENIPKFLKELAKNHPELKAGVEMVLSQRKSDFVKVTTNKSNNFMIEYRDVE